MKLSDFIMLTEAEKKFAVLHCGVLVAKRNEPPHIFFLFQMDHFYVETCCHSLKKDIEAFTAFNRFELLEPYLETIPIDDLMN